MKKQAYQKPTIEMECFAVDSLLNSVSTKTNIDNLGGGDTSGSQGEAWSRGGMEWNDVWDE